MKEYEVMELRLTSLLASAQNGDDLPVSRPDSCTPVLPRKQQALLVECQTEAELS